MITFITTSLVVVFLPLPLWSKAPVPARIAVAAVLALSLMTTESRTTVDVPGALAVIAVTGFQLLIIGTVIHAAIDFLGAGIAAVSVQAGFSFASTIDPTLETDNEALAKAMATIAGVVIVATNIDLIIIRATVSHLAHLATGIRWMEQLEAGLALSCRITSNSLKAALPLAATFLTIDVLAGALSRLSPNFQTTNLSFSVKLLCLMWLLVQLSQEHVALQREVFFSVVQRFGLQ